MFRQHYPRHAAIMLSRPGECDWQAHVEVRKLTHESSQWAQAVEKASEEFDSQKTPTQLAHCLTRKIKNGLNILRKLRAEDGQLPDYCSGNAASSEPTKSSRGPYSCDASYEDIRKSFEQKASHHGSLSEENRILGWCSAFSAGTLDSIAHYLPVRRVESQQAGDPPTTRRQDNAYRRERSRRREFSRLVNSIVDRFDKKPRIIYLALAGESPPLDHGGWHC